MHTVCNECGRLANYVTCMARFGEPPKQAAYEVSTFSKGTCKYCGRETMVTEERDFFYPSFELIDWKLYRKIMGNWRDKDGQV